MFARLRRLLGSTRGSTLLRSDYARESKQLVENTDAMASMIQGRTDPSGVTTASFPPDYVRPVDEGRPRH